MAQVEELAKEREVEVDESERKLRDRAHEIESLRRDIAHRDQLVHELIASLEESRDQVEVGQTADAATPQAEVTEALRTQLDGLAGTAAHREAELHAARWRIQELENSLSQAHAQHDLVSANAELERALCLAQAELESLRGSELTAHECPDQPDGSGPGPQTVNAEVQQQLVLLGSLQAAKQSSSNNSG